MKHLPALTAKLLAATSAFSLSVAFAAPPAPVAAATPAATKVYQRTDNAESIELSNLDESDAAQTPLTLGAQPQTPGTTSTSSGSAKAAVAAAGRTTPAKVSKKIKKKIRLADGTEEEVLVDSDDEDTDGLAQADGTAADSSRNDRFGANARSGDANGGAGFVGGNTQGAGYAGAGYAGTGSGTSGGGSNVATGTGTATASSGTSGGGSGSGTGAGSSGSGSAGTVAVGNGNTGTIAPLPTPTSALETQLANYRNLMLTEVAAAQVANPALTRRYLAMDRSTYQIRIRQ